MKWREWDDLPKWMQNPEVKAYYDILNKKKFSLALKRMFDVVAATGVLLVTAAPMAVIAVMIKLDSKGPVFYRQERVTAYGRKFRIHKFRTMAEHADRMGAAVTVDGDSRITKAGAKLRSLRLDELPQVFDVLEGNMSFVGTRPEVTKYVKKYSREMRATLLLPAGITSEASIRYKEEARRLDAADDIDNVYVEDILPGKMKYNLQAIRTFSFWGEIAILFRTVLAVMGKEYEQERRV